MSNPIGVILGGNYGATPCVLTPYAGSVHGYAQLQLTNAGRKQSEYAHRLAYRLFYGAIPRGAQIDHLCNTRRCVNPLHLRAVSPRDNRLDTDRELSQPMLAFLRELDRRGVQHVRIA